MSLAVSVVIPVYNSEKYLKDCVDSLLTQTLRNVEFLFVDDGSTDESVNILHDYQRLDNRIKIIMQNNLGAGAARNKGLRVSCGKYIVFLDSDDFFDARLLEESYNYAEKKQAEVVLYDSYIYNDRTKEKRHERTKMIPYSVFSYKDLGSELYTLCKSVPWNKFVLRSFLQKNNIKFQEIQKSNDLLYALLCVSLAKRMVFIPKCFVNYRVGNPYSLQGNIDTGIECGIISRSELKKELISRNIFHGSIKEAFYECCKGLLSYVDRITRCDAMEILYFELKKHLVSDLFDSVEECNDKVFTSIIDADSFEEFMFFIYLENKKKNISKDCAEYRVGNAILSLPRKILRKPAMRGQV